MQISVLQQKIRSSYGMGQKEPPLDVLRREAAFNLEEAWAMIDEAGRRASDLAVTVEAINGHLNCADTRWPFAEIYEGLDGETVQRFADKARAWKMHIVAGLYLVIGGKAYNCAVLFDDAGEIVGVHRKVHLPAGEERQITHGDRLDVFETKLGRIGMQVCWDMQFPESARIQALKGAELIALPTLGWENIYGVCRAYENSVSIAAAMGFGGEGPLPEGSDPSCIVDPMGRIVAQAARAGSEVVTCELDIHRDPPPQYGSENYIDSMSMRKTRFLQRRPGVYSLLSEQTEDLPLYARYFPGTQKKTERNA